MDQNKKSLKLPPGQFITPSFPVLSKGPSVHVPQDRYSLSIEGLVQNPMILNFKDLVDLESKEITCNIHCVTKWSKLDTKWTGVEFETIVQLVKPAKNALFVVFGSFDGYKTNIPLKILLEDGYLVYKYDQKPIEDIHGGPVRALVPRLYFWKSAKWLNSITFLDHDEPGFWETRGYSNSADPIKEERYS